MSNCPLSPRGTSGERAGERGFVEIKPPLPDPLLLLGRRGNNKRNFGKMKKKDTWKPMSILVEHDMNTERLSRE
jgi:hypothetical protein